MATIQPKINQSTFQATKINKPDNKPQNKEQTGMSKADKSLVGASVLAAIVVAGIALKGNVKKSTNNTQLEKLKKQANELKDKIRRTYQAKLESQVPIEDFFSLIVQDGLKQGGKRNITSSKDFDKAKEYIIHLHENIGPNRDFYNPAKQLKNKVYKDIKSKLTDLQKDSDWVELRKKRKNLLKQKNKENRAIIDNHIELIDNILLSKVSKDSSILHVFEEFYGMSIKDATKLAKNSTQTVYEKVEYKSKFRLFENIGMGLRKLKLSDFFKKEVKEWNSANNTVNNYETTFKFLDAKKQKFIEFQKSLAQEIRQSEDVKALKELNKKIAELKKNAATT